MAKVLITGAAGFIGSSLAAALVQEGAQVRGLDDLSTGKPSNLDAAPGMEFIQASILDREALTHACRGVELIFHEAAIPSVPLSVQDPLGTNDANLNGTLLLLECARKAGVRRVVYAASSAAYGDDPELPKVETMLPAPMTPYAVQKVAGEHYLASYSRVYGLETIALRYFNVFGPRQDPSSQYSGVLARFISLMSRGERPTIFGDGSTSRDFVFIDNVVNANLLAAKASSAAVSGSVLNVATGRSTTLLEAFAEVARCVGFNGPPHFAPEREGDIRHSLADITRAQTRLGYRVKTGFAEGLSRTVAWCRETVTH